MSYTTDDKEGFIHRWSRLKQHNASDDNAEALDTEVSDELQSCETTTDNMLTDADMPAVDSLDENSDVSGFFSKRVSEELRRAALRKLFHLPAFNLTDGLNDYDEDFTRQSELLDWASRKIPSAEATKENSHTDSHEVIAENNVNVGSVSADQEGVFETGAETETETERTTCSHSGEAGEKMEEPAGIAAREDSPKGRNQV